jgi:hypothetical protein
VGSLVLAGLLAATAGLRAEGDERAAQRKRVEQALERLEDRLRDATPEGLVAVTNLDLARRHVALARKLLARSNDRAAAAMAAQAQQLLDEVREKAVGQ